MGFVSRFLSAETCDTFSTYKVVAELQDYWFIGEETAFLLCDDIWGWFKDNLFLEQFVSGCKVAFDRQCVLVVYINDLAYHNQDLLNVWHDAEAGLSRWSATVAVKLVQTRVAWSQQSYSPIVYQFGHSHDDNVEQDNIGNLFDIELFVHRMV